MSAFDNIKINTPGGTLYTGGNSTTTGTGNTISGSSTSNGCETCLNSILITNLGPGHPLYQGKGSYNVFNFRSIVAGTGATITHDDKSITIGIDTSGIAIDGATTLQALTDVAIDESSITTGQVLTWNGTKWDAETPATGGGSSNVQNLTDLLDVSVDETKITTGQALVWNGTKWDAETIQSGGGTSNVKDLSDLEDVSASSPTQGQVLTWNGTSWDAETPSTGGTTSPAGLSPMYILRLPVLIQAGIAGVTGIGDLPDGWSATVTDPSTQKYNITVTHNTGLLPIAFSSSGYINTDPTTNKVMIESTNTLNTAYLSYQPTVPNVFMINYATVTNIKMSPNPDLDQTATLFVIMG